MSHSMMEIWRKKVSDAMNAIEHLKKERYDCYKSVQDMAKADAIKTDQAIERMNGLDVIIRKNEKIVKVYNKKIETAIETANRYRR